MKDMDNVLGVVLMEQLAQGNKCDGWKPQALQAAMEHLNSSLGLNLAKENIKNRPGAWKKYHGIVKDIQFENIGFHWDEERKMIIITHAELPAWNAYVKGNPEAKFMKNKEIRNWDDIVMLCGRDRAIGEGVETFDEAADGI
ncbi:hypothetical protein LIER_04074 [Lithospermum erythrorhizon]|uniref:Myb/SANT-like domain-containing protein n=1 Tax=Lithospermum erythrorhizon TaxID=34254 RepID=A0AAV3NVH5_LITER